MPLISKPDAPRPTNFVGNPNHHGNIRADTTAAKKAPKFDPFDPYAGIRQPERSFKQKKTRRTL